MSDRRHLAKGLAFAFLAGAWTEDALLARGLETLADGPARLEGLRWLRSLVQRAMKAFPSAPLDRDDALARALAWFMSARAGHDEDGDADFDDGDDGDDAAEGQAQPLGAEDEEPPLPPPREDLRIRRWLIPDATMLPVDGPPKRFPVAPLASAGELGRAIGLDAVQLAWHADERRLNVTAREPRLLHYHYRWVAKARGGWRLLEAPKARLKRIQRWLLREILDAIPASDVAHGFVQGRSVRTFVAPHVGRAVVLRMDLEDFFASVRRSRVRALLRRVGYPRRVAATLAALCTAPTPDAVLAAHPRESVDLAQRFLTNARLRDAHLPQGAPTSPALSNLAAWRLDRRLAGLAAAFGATITRYADDLAVSGDEAFGRSLRFFIARAGAIALEEGFRVNDRKTRVMRQGRRQSLCGVVVNDRANLPRRERDRLRATLFNAARFGLDGQNRDGRPDFRRHLEGRVAWASALNPDFGRRAKALLARVSAPPRD